LCFNTERLIRMKFIEGCLENLANNWWVFLLLVLQFIWRFYSRYDIRTWDLNVLKHTSVSTIQTAHHTRHLLTNSKEIRRSPGST
jgi:hypothetical protein